VKLGVHVLALTAACLLGRHDMGRSMPAPLLDGAPAWTVMGEGVELGETVISAPNEGRSTRLVLLRFDPRLVSLNLVTRLREDYRGGDWAVDQASDRAVASLNAGQFTGLAPWGWTVKDGREMRAPGFGPLSMAVVEDSSGRVHFVEPDSIEGMRARAGVRTAIQSFPTLLEGDGEIPAALSDPGSVDVLHRDARLAIAHLTDGRVLILLTRFDLLGDIGASVPFGITLRETAELLRSLGARRAVALDGGISAQMQVRDSNGTPRTWRGWRRVPAGLELNPR
jgi:exopolysaccharide biosynthesis protein